MAAPNYRTIGTQNLQEQLAALLCTADDMAGELVRRGLSIPHDFVSLAVEIEDADHPSDDEPAPRFAPQDYARFREPV